MIVPKFIRRDNNYFRRDRVLSYDIYRLKAIAVRQIHIQENDV
jgi:hypothetical protein